MAREIASPIVFNGISLTAEQAMKGLEKIAVKQCNSVRNYESLLYKTRKFEEFKIKGKVMSGLPDAVSWDGESIIASQSISELYDYTAQQYGYANAAEFSWKAKRFDTYKFLKQATDLGRSMAYKRQKAAASLFNNGFTVNGPDGVPLFSAAHPYAPNSGLTTQSNLVSGPLGVTSLQDAIHKMIDMRDPLGKPLNLEPRRLYVYPTKVMYAKQFLGLGMGNEYNTADSKRNPFKDFNIEVVPYPHLGTETMWLLQGNETETYICVNTDFTYSSDQTDAHGLKLDAYFWVAYWQEGFWGWVGSTGL